jgi:SAM-dependent methyltransferase
VTLDALGPNAEQIRYWNETIGPRWVAMGDLLDAQIAPLGLAAIERAHPARGEQVLDVGCGCGQTSLQLAERVGPEGGVLGIDISAPMLERAHARTAGHPNLRFANADAQTHAFGERFDLVFSRFGVMFFADPAAAFANLRRALRPGGRIAFVCWQGIDRNPWILVPLRAVVGIVPLPEAPPPDAPGPFSFADPERVQRVLEAGGFEKVALERLEGELSIGAGGDLDRAMQFTMQMGPVSAALREAGEDARARAADAIRAALEPLVTPDGVRAGFAAWIATAATSSGPASPTR